MRVQDLMSHPAITCHANDHVSVPAKLMWDHDCGMIPVVRDDGKLVGVITDRDICMAAYTQGRSLDEIYVSVVMAMHAISAHPDQQLAEVERLMAEHQVRRIPVVDDDGKPIGVLSLNDLANEAVQPDTRLKDAFSQVTHTLAAVCAPRSQTQQAASDGQPAVSPGARGQRSREGRFPMFLDPDRIPIFQNPKVGTP